MSYEPSYKDLEFCALNRGLRFLTLSPGNPELNQIVEREIRNKISPHYPCWKDFLDKVKRAADRTTEVLFFIDQPVGLIVYKKDLNSEFLQFGISNGLELKTIFTFAPSAKYGGLFFSLLLSKTAGAAVQANASCIFGTVSSNNPKSLDILTTNRGFTIKKVFKDMHKKGVDEVLVSHESPTRLLESGIDLIKRTSCVN